MAIAGTFLSLPTFSQVPHAAQTFEANVKITNATETMAAKINMARDHIKRVISSEEFRQRVLNHSYNGVVTFVDNNGLTNEQIYQKILEGAESLNKNPNNAMDIEIEMYYEDSNTVGYTYGSTSKIFANTKYYNSYKASTITGNITHEWLHKLGFTHAVNYSESRNYSVPYAIGSIVRGLANSADLEYLTAARNVSISNSTTDVSLNWGAALSSHGIAEYKIFRRLDGSATNYLQTSTTELLFTQGLPSTNATYYVRAVDMNGNTTKSVEVNYVQLTAVSDLRLTKTSSSVVLNWSAADSSAGVKEYKIYRRLVGSSTNFLQGSTTSLSFTQERPSSSAYYYVRSVDINGVTQKSVEVYFSK
jgi:hypothetical protein